MTTLPIYALIQKLPQDIIWYIIPYTYMPQSIPLLQNIRNFVKTRETVYIMYCNKYEELLQYEKYAYKHWLVNDVILFIKYYKNNDIYRSVCYLYTDDFITQKDIFARFNYFWNILSVSERNLFIQIRTKLKKPLL